MAGRKVSAISPFTATPSHPSFTPGRLRAPTPPSSQVGGRAGASRDYQPVGRMQIWRSMLIALLLAQALHGCPADLSQWKVLLGAEWIGCHQVADLTTSNNP